MKMNKLHSKLMAFSIFLTLTVCIVLPTQTNALKVDETCAKVEIIFARGSGGDTPNDKETDRYVGQIQDRLKKSPISKHSYILGSETYDDHKYPHVDVGDFKNGNALAAVATFGYGPNAYGNSVRSGVGELTSYLAKRYNKCKSTGSYYVLGGYSQGAQVIGDALPLLPTEVRNRVIYVGLFGDPKLFYPEGIRPNPILPPPACFGIRSPYRKSQISPLNCMQVAGILGPRLFYLPDDMMQKTGLWCYDGDIICGGSPNPWALDHSAYKNEGLAIDQAAQEAAQKLAAAISKEPKPRPSPSPTPNPSKSIDTKPKKGTGITGQDIVFIVDAEDSMKPLLPSIKQLISTKGAQVLQSPGGRISLGRYGGGLTEDGPPLQPEDTTKGLLNYGQWLLDNMSTIDKVHAPYPDSPIFTLQTVLDYMDWRPGATKATMLITNKANLDNSSEFAAIAKRALAIDPVNVYPIVPEGSQSTYQKLADLTSGQVTFYSDGGFEAAANAAFDKIQNRPVPFLTNTEYIADPGQEITFDASDSYVIDSEITKYDWDFDGDGTFETSTTDPIIHHTYTQKGDGIMQVRVTAANGLIANASATLKIGTYVPPALPKTPQNLQASIIKTENGKSTVRLTWDPVNDDLTTKLVLSANSVMLGTMTPDRTSIDVTDIDRLIDVDFSLAGMTNVQEMGPAAFASLASSEPIVFPSIVTSDPEEEIVTSVSHAQGDSPRSEATTADPTESPTVLGAQTTIHSATSTNNSSENTSSRVNSSHSTSNLEQLWWLLVPGAATIASIAWAITRHRH